MQLQSEAGDVVTDPDDDQIEEALRALDGDENPAAQLTADDGSFVQTAWGPGDDWLLEWHDDENDEHLEATDSSITIDDVIAAFRDHAAGDEEWRTRFSWEAMDL